MVESGLSRPDLCTGVLQRANGIVKLRNHIFVPDSRDGGLSNWIPGIPAWEGFSQSKQVDNGQLRNPSSPDESSALQAYCQCRGVHFKITRPNEHPKDLMAPDPDLLLSDKAKKTPAVGEDKKWWLCANGTKYLAGICACRTCRLVSGFDIQTWAFVPLSNLLQTNGDFIKFDMDNLRQYDSTDGVHRHFCGRCGATIFYRNEERPDLIDVSVGLLDSSQGARAESWLEWRIDRISFQEEAQNEELISRLGAGLRVIPEIPPSN
ncbi:hypothetical protein ACLMJK_004628 [Lecanora helva]